MFQFEIEDPIAALEAHGDGSVPLNDINCGFKLGDQIKCDQNIGEVKYIGPVGSYAGIWLGIEWNDHRRGKHSGTVDGIEYFVSSVPNAASFIRPAKAGKLRKLMEAFYERYGEDKAVMASLKSIDDRLEKKKFSYSSIKILDLSSMGIYDLNEWKELVKISPSVEFLQLADNYIKDWSSVGMIVGHFSRLIRIDLSRNPISVPTSEEIAIHQSSFSKMYHIILGGVEYNWYDICTASELWPQIVTLTAPFNRIVELSSSLKTFMNLTSIDFDKSQITEWTEVMKLGALPKLEYLNLCGNKINNITIPVQDSMAGAIFPCLERLNLTENFIEEWTSVSELSKLGKLTELRIDINPFLNVEKRANNRQFIIARIEKLIKLEGVEIERQERRDAELDYVKKYARDWEEETDKEKFDLLHPRYSILVKKFGRSHVPSKSESQPNSMSSALINLIIVPESALKYKECEKKILKTMTVQKLKGLLQRLFKIPAVPIKITVVSCKNPAITFLLENDFMELQQYSVDEGDTLLLSW